MITQTFNLNLIPNSAPIIVHVDQYDHGTGRLIANLFNGNTPYSPSGMVVVIYQGRKPDGRGFMYQTFEISGNTVTMDLTEQMTAVSGRVFCQVVVEEETPDSEHRTGSFVFFLEVQPSALPADTDMSRSEYQIIEELLEEARAINTNFPYIGQNGNWWYYDVSQGGYVDSGVDASITVTVGTTTTLPAGSSATVTNSGTPTDPILNFGIPKGDKGDKGDTGATGPAGRDGVASISYDAENEMLIFST